MNDKWLELLYRSLDGDLSPEERRQLEEALGASPELREERARLLELRQWVHDDAIRRFEPFFASRLLQRVRRETRGNEDLVAALMWAFRKIAVVGAVTLALLLADHLFVQKHRSLDDILGGPQVTLEDTWQLDSPLMEETP